MDKKRKLLAGLLLAAGLLCAGISFYLYQQEKHAGEAYEDLQKDTELQGESEESGVEIPIDFAQLQKENKDIYAWIRIPNTEIDYPIVQHAEDDTYYLDHNAQKEEDQAGAIFTESYNTKTFDDPNTVLYGHNMKNGTMFRGLHDYADRSFFDDHREVLVYLPERILHYQVFAAYLYDNRHIIQSIDFENPKIYQAYLDQIFQIRDMNASIDTSMDVTSEDRIITLSTCNAGIETQRYLVQAVLVSIDE